MLLQVELDFTMIGVKEDQIKKLSIHPFELAPTEVAKGDQLMIPQHPLTRDYQQQTPMGISLGPCKNTMGKSFVLFMSAVYCNVPNACI